MKRLRERVREKWNQICDLKSVVGEIFDKVKQIEEENKRLREAKFYVDYLAVSDAEKKMKWYLTQLHNLSSRECLPRDVFTCIDELQKAAREFVVVLDEGRGYASKMSGEQDDE